ncbi:phage gp6-like head-tail connector protein [Staphylococcus pseudintermedius]|uniref:Phage gp6-like head-tail connector protein n=1 Tax=Staphylococcus canis TaxID=2724942 RepID=A0ABS0T8Y6_9STAP|nr:MULTISPECIES: phage gp6-like head-tail connector protein [Staphylococcus]EGQ0314116.1 phage gp6-like head-tail connector protein [Staphylococcus pseudintermedius]EGQ0379311.1 phage gp6-like head-tail connector protein [Staphylococcus pseudintermedius]EGQ0389620.1 phage gp6-like head-tail connector protein [Staphylococcus pseudintermedius]EGQ1640324.1 phage gp6-like head-tail connector protein [Staphylococcus pseudintermedius]EGQ1675945.1 phage gp6-like head-tail connector protein [Staphyloc
MITQNHVNEMKRRLKIFHTFEDEHIKDLIKQSYADIERRCQSFDIDNNEVGKELVYERVRYAYNDSLEYFNENFLSQITSFALSNMKEVDYEQEL